MKFLDINVTPHPAPFPSFFCSDLRSDAALIWVWPERGMDSLGRIYWGPSESQLTLHSNRAITWQFASVCVCVRLNLLCHMFSVLQGPKYPVTLWDQRTQKLAIGVMSGKNDQKSNNCPQLWPRKSWCACTWFFYWFLSPCSLMNRQGGILLSFGPSVSTSPPHGKWRFGIEAKRLIALATSIRIHLKTGLETKWWFLNSEADLDIWVSKQSHPLVCLSVVLVCVCVRVFCKWSQARGEERGWSRERKIKTSTCKQVRTESLRSLLKERRIRK